MTVPWNKALPVKPNMLLFSEHWLICFQTGRCKIGAAEVLRARLTPPDQEPVWLWKWSGGNASYCPGRCGDFHSSCSTAEGGAGWSGGPGRCSSLWASGPEASWFLQTRTWPGDRKTQAGGRWEGFTGFQKLSCWCYCYLPGWMSGFGGVSDLVSGVRLKVGVGPVENQLGLDGLHMWEVDWRSWFHWTTEKWPRLLAGFTRSALSVATAFARLALVGVSGFLCWVTLLVDFVR